MPSPSALLTRVRADRPALDHLIRAFGRYQADAGDRQAASVTFFGFLSFFPLLALATALLSYALGDEAVDTVVAEVNAYAPGLAEQLGLRDLLTSNAQAGATGLLGLLGLLYSGLGWVDALRKAIRTMWHQDLQTGNLVVTKLYDVVVLAGLGITLVTTVLVSAATGAFTDFALDLAGLETTPAATLLAKLLGVVLGVLTSTLLFLYLFWRLPRVRCPLRRVVRGAVLAAVLFEVLKRVGAFYVERTTENPIYGIFAVVVGLLVWINIVARMLLFCAAWTVTAPYDSDVEPSGTAALHPGPEAVRGELAERTASAPATAPSAPAWAGTPPVRSQVAVQQAATLTAGAIGMALTAVLIHVVRTLRDVVRR